MSKRAAETATESAAKTAKVAVGSHWTCSRKRFYGICLGGLEAQITVNYTMDELDADEEIDKYIADHLVFEANSAIGLGRKWFNSGKFLQMLRDPGANEIAHRILDFFEERDMSVRDTYLESCFANQDDCEFAKYYVKSWQEKDLLGYGWYLLKKKHKLWKVTNFWWRIAGESQHREGGSGRARAREEFEAECA